MTSVMYLGSAPPPPPQLPPLPQVVEANVSHEEVTEYDEAEYMWAAAAQFSEDTSGSLTSDTSNGVSVDSSGSPEAPVIGSIPTPFSLVLATLSPISTSTETEKPTT